MTIEIPGNSGRNAIFPGSDASDPLAVLRSKYRYTAAVILEFARKFGELRDRTMDYTTRIVRRNGMPAIVMEALAAEVAKPNKNLERSRPQRGKRPPTTHG